MVKDESSKFLSTPLFKKMKVLATTNSNAAAMAIFPMGVRKNIFGLLFAIRFCNFSGNVSKYDAGSLDADLS